MTIAMNPARMPCPQLNSTGKCFVDNCPYNHSVIEFGKPTAAAQQASDKTKLAQVLTGSGGQFVGTRKGANAVPVATTQGLPSFVKKAAEKLGTIKATQKVSAIAPTLVVLATSPMSPPPGLAAPTFSPHSDKDTDDVDILKQRYANLQSERQGLESSLIEVNMEADSLEKEVAALREQSERIKQRSSRSGCSNDLQQLVASNRATAIQIKLAEDLANVHEAMITECRQTYGTLLDRIEDTDIISVDRPKYEINALMNSIEKQFKQLNRIIQNVRVDFTSTARNRQNELLASQGFAPGEYLNIIRNK
jgi:hypothetical protein